MYDDTGNYRCDHCKQLIPDVMLWVEIHGTYKFRGTYNVFKWHFCDLHCLKDYLSKLDWNGIEVAIHKVAVDNAKKRSK